MKKKMRTPLSKSETARADAWLKGAKLTTIRGVTGATLADSGRLEMFIKLETGTVVVLNHAHIERLETNIAEVKAAHAKFLAEHATDSSPPEILI